jgi:hypothetical protein
MNMLEALKMFGSGESASDAATLFAREGPFPEGVEDERGSPRFPFAGAEVFLFTTDDQRFRLRLRNLSCSGISGLTDAPLAQGESVIVQLEEMLMPAATVVWTRRSTLGFEFINALPLARMKRIRERQDAGAAWSPAMRAGSDLHTWWTDLNEQKNGRQTRLRAGGHKHPLEH